MTPKPGYLRIHKGNPTHVTGPQGVALIHQEEIQAEELGELKRPCYTSVKEGKTLVVKKVARPGH
jgi:hypothetical protein